MKTINKISGFSAIELLITLFVASVFLISGYQLYVSAIRAGGEARAQTSANNVASDYLQRYKASATNPCTNQTVLNSIPITVSGLSNVTVSVLIECKLVPHSSLASGGTVTYTDSSGLNPKTSPAYTNGYVVHTFTNSGTFISTTSGNIEILIVAGGGGGGKAEANPGGDGAGGGGAGGIIYKASQAVAVKSYGVTVGPGGAGTINGTYPNIARGGNGSNSTFSDILTAIGGGGGGSDNDASTTLNMGAVGGSSGGAANAYNQSTAAAAATSGQGYAGGDALTNSTAYRGGSGGGGAGGVGVTRTGTAGGAGGTGVTYGISGTTVAYGGGGGGGVDGYFSTSPGAGGLGGGAAGGSTDSTGGNGSANTGGGGGGGGSNNGSGGNGGSGIVIIRYPYPNPPTTLINSVSKITVTVKYGDPQKTVTSSIYVKL